VYDNRSSVRRRYHGLLPNGEEAWEYGGPACIEDGPLAVKIQTAINDLTGDWKVVAKERCTGQEARPSSSAFIDPGGHHCLPPENDDHTVSNDFIKLLQARKRRHEMRPATQQASISRPPQASRVA